jgi:hypothetical protein
VEAYHRSEFVMESGMQIDSQPLQVNARRVNVSCVLYGMSTQTIRNEVSSHLGLNSAM